jgi:hypothetical protein
LSENLNEYEIAGFTVQSYLDEETTSAIFMHALEKGKLGRTTLPRRAFPGLDKKLLWERKFWFKHRRYLIKGGGKKIAIFEHSTAREQIAAKQDYRRCTICRMRHPDSDLHETEQGPMCEPCYDALHPRCAECGVRLDLPEDLDPEDGPFYCEECE